MIPRTTVAEDIPLLPDAQLAALSDVLVDELGQLEHGRLRLAAKEGLELVVRVDVAPVLRVLQLVRSNVLPDLFGDLGAGQSSRPYDGAQYFVSGIPVGCG
jgi:hypothetical protein